MIPLVPRFTAASANIPGSNGSTRGLPIVERRAIRGISIRRVKGAEVVASISREAMAVPLTIVTIPPSGRMGRVMLHHTHHTSSAASVSNGAISSGTAPTGKGTSKTKMGRTTQVERAREPAKANLRAREKEEKASPMVARENQMARARAKARTAAAKARAKASIEGTYRNCQVLACGNMMATVGKT